MPRASTTTTEETPKRAPRKRAVRRTVTKTEAPVRRTRAPRAVVREEEEVVAAPVRRAPTPLAAEARATTAWRKRLMMVGGVSVFVFGVAAWIGFLDDGQIDVAARITEVNSQAPVANQEVVQADGTVATIPVQTSQPPAAISGLRGRGVGTAPTPQQVPATEEATTTEEVATSTESVSDTTEDEDTTEANTEPVAADPAPQ